MLRQLLFMVAIGSAIGAMLPLTKQVPPPPPRDAGWQPTPHPTTLARSANGHFYADGRVNGTEIHFVVDTGATDVVLTMDDARRAKIPFDPTSFTVVATGASGDVYGQLVVLDVVDLDGKQVHQMQGMVAQGLAVSLLGQRYLREQPHVDIAGDTMTIG